MVRGVGDAGVRAGRGGRYRRGTVRVTDEVDLALAIFGPQVDVQHKHGVIDVTEEL